MSSEASFEYEKQPGQINALSFHPDGSHFAVGGEGGEIRIYETESGNRVATIKVGENVTFTLAYRPDGKELAAGGIDGVVRIYDPASGALKKEFVAAPISSDGAVKSAR